MAKKNTSIILLLFTLLSSAQVLQAQVTIAPILLTIEQQDRFGTILVMNGSEQPQEISIEFPFGYPQTNETGNLQMVYGDSTTAQKWSISEQIKGFPTNFVLQPGQRQVVRLMIQPDQKFRNGVYWSRIRTTSTPQSPEVGETSDDEITAQITYKFEQVTAVFYKYGNVNTGVKVPNFQTQLDSTGQNRQFVIDSERTGNAPFLGNIQLIINDKSGDTVLQRSSSVAIYFDYRQIFEVAKSALPAGAYSAQVTFSSQRTDIPQNELVQMEPVTKSIDFQVR